MSTGTQDSVTGTLDGAPSPQLESGLADLVALVREQEQIIVEKAKAAAMWQARAEMLAWELADAKRRLGVLARGHWAHR